FSAIEPALAEGRDPGGDAMLDRRRPFDQPCVDLTEARRLIDGGEFVRRGIPVAGLDRRHVAANDQLLVQRLAQLLEVSLAAHLAGEAAAGLERAEDSAGGLLLCQYPVEGGIRKGRVEL